MKRVLIVFIITWSPYALAKKCQSSEVLIAFCNISDNPKKEAVICANKKRQTVRYEFKRNNTTELEVAFTPQSKLSRWIDLGTYTTYLGFNKGMYSYILRVPSEKVGAIAVLNVKKNNLIINEMKCDSNSFGDSTLSITSIKDIPDEEVRGDYFNFP